MSAVWVPTFLLLYGLFDFLLCTSESHPLQPVHMVLVHDHETQNDGEPPERVGEHGAGVRVSAKPVEPPRGAKPDRVGREAGEREGPGGEAGERDEHGADTGEEEDVSERDEPVLSRVEDSQHAVPALGVRAADNVRQRVEMRELPREHEREQRPRRQRVVQQ